MNKQLVISLAVTALSLYSCSTTGNMTSRTVATFNHFKGDVTEMSPRRYPSCNVSYGYHIELRNDSSFIYLPYMGEVHSPILNDCGLNFIHPYKNMNIARNKKGTATIASFCVNHGILTYTFRLEAFDGGYFSLYVQPSNAQGCNYSGRWEE